MCLLHPWAKGCSQLRRRPTGGFFVEFRGQSSGRNSFGAVSSGWDFNQSDYMQKWKENRNLLDLSALKTPSIVDRHLRPEIIFLLKVDDLPEDNQGRFNSLFSLSEKWIEEDIAPYIQDLCGEKQTIGALLTKYSRSSMQNGVKVYNSRRPIS